MFKASIGPVQALLADKYSALVPLADLASASLDELLVDTLYVQARRRSVATLLDDPDRLPSLPAAPRT